MKLSARDILKGKVMEITQGSAAKLGLAVGKESHAVIKASAVMVAVD